MAVAPKKTPTLAPHVPVTAAAAVHETAAAKRLPEAAKVEETLAAPAREMQESLRQAAEKGVAESRAAYARVKTSAEDATQSLETSYAAACEGVTAINAKTVEALRVNVEAGFGFLKALTGAKSLPEAMEVQTGHMRKQFDTLAIQARDMAALAQKIAKEAAAPIKAGIDKAFAQAN